MHGQCCIILAEASYTHTPQCHWRTRRSLHRWAGAANVDMNSDGVSDLLIGAFLVPGLYIVPGDGGSPRDNSIAIIMATVSGVLGCLFCLVREARIWVSFRLSALAFISVCTFVLHCRTLMSLYQLGPIKMCSVRTHTRQ